MSVFIPYIKITLESKRAVMRICLLKLYDRSHRRLINMFNESGNPFTTLGNVGIARSIQSSPYCSMHILESFYAYSICSYLFFVVMDLASAPRTLCQARCGSMLLRRRVFKSIRSLFRTMEAVNPTHVPFIP